MGTVIGILIYPKLPSHLHECSEFLPITSAQNAQGNQCSSTRKLSATVVLEAEGIEVAPVVLHHRKAFYSHWQQGKTAEDADPEGKAAAEARDLMLWVCERLGLTTASGELRKIA